MKATISIVLLLVCLFCSNPNFAQHTIQIEAFLNNKAKTLNVKQNITFYNQTNDTLNSIVLNDWNNAFSKDDTPLAKRFSDEFYLGFHIASEFERGSTVNLIIFDQKGGIIPFDRSQKNPDLVTLNLQQGLLPGEKISLYLTYISKIPHAKFTKYGYADRDRFYLKDWFLTPARFENHQFVQNNNYNLDDIANDPSDFTIELTANKNFKVTTDLIPTSILPLENETTHLFFGKNRSDFNLFLEPDTSFKTYLNDIAEVATNLKSNDMDEIQKAVIIDRVVRFTNAFLGNSISKKIIVSQADYDRNPFYGLNQLPAFLSPFTKEFVFEIQFLKTYLNAYLKNNLRLNPRKDNWVYDGIQIFTLMKYMEENHPNSKMLGSASKFRILKSYHLTTIGFNDQFSYYYLLMARKNLDQPLNASKNDLIKFNEQIASKYRSGISLNYLDRYLENNSVPKSIQEFLAFNKIQKEDSKSFVQLLKNNASKDIEWFFKTIIDSRALIDYKFKEVTKTDSTVTFSLKNKTNTLVPIPIYGLKNKNIVFKQWVEPSNNDSLYTFDRKNADKIVLNYQNEVPEINLRNNWQKLEGFFPNNRPLKFTAIKDLEDPYYNQVLYAPILTYNIYDGLSPGIRLHNKTILNKPFTFDINPTYSIKTQNLSGGVFLAVNKDYRNSTHFNVKYLLNGSYYHYAPDATYLKINPSFLLQIREENMRDNRKQFVALRQVIVNREESEIVIDNSLRDYSVFNAKYFNTKTELSNHVSFVGDVQFAKEFGKISTEIQYRKLFKGNRQVYLRMFAGSFIYNTTDSDFFSFALDRPTDYLFDYNYYGRSEDTGFFSRQFVLAEGGFKSKLSNPYSNKWITTLNATGTIWNWIEAYGDIGFISNKGMNARFVYDGGIRLNLLTDYFELYFPVYSNNGWEISQSSYHEKIRFVITFDPSKLINLFTRKWF